MLKKILLTILVAVLLLGAGMGFSFWRGIQDIKALSVYDVDLRGVPDAVYSGEMKAGAIQVLLDVTVTDGAITDIEILRHDNGQGEAAENIVDRIIAEQSLDVDMISGATYSSKVILKAVENALN